MIRLAVRAPAAEAELVLAALLELAPRGVEQVDRDGEVEFAVYGAPGELPELDPGEAEVGGVRVAVSGSEVPDDWADRWRRFHEPILVADRLYIRPSWAASAPRPDTIDLEIDPGRAFGTGSHSTTRLCLELLVGLEGERGPLCDLGCGSGVLAIAAAKLGHRPVEAVDFDPLAVDATHANAARNGVALDVVRRLDLREEAVPTADVVVANLMRPLLLQVAGRLEGPPRVLILSGLLDAEADEVAAAFAPLRERRRLSDRGWTALELASPAEPH